MKRSAESASVRGCDVFQILRILIEHGAPGHSSFLQCFRSSYFNSTGISSPSSSSASRKQRLTSASPCPPVICLVAAKISLPEASTIRRYPHQLPCKPNDQWRNAFSYFELPRSQVLKAAGTKYFSATCLMTGFAKITFPASLHPCFVSEANKRSAGKSSELSSVCLGRWGVVSSKRMPCVHSFDPLRSLEPTYLSSGPLDKVGKNGLSSLRSSPQSCVKVSVFTIGC
jgi:hypothetical protein